MPQKFENEKLLKASNIQISKDFLPTEGSMAEIPCSVLTCSMETLLSGFAVASHVNTLFVMQAVLCLICSFTSQLSGANLAGDFSPSLFGENAIADACMLALSVCECCSL